jgi:hypothetical protein
MIGAVGAEGHFLQRCWSQDRRLRIKRYETLSTTSQSRSHLCCSAPESAVRGRGRGPRGPGAGARGADAAGDTPGLRRPGAVTVLTSAPPPAEVSSAVRSSTL